MSDDYELVLPHHELSPHYEIGLVVSSYNRPHYVKRFLHYLSRSDLAGVLVLLVDDCSDDPTTRALLANYSLPAKTGGHLVKAYRKQKNGMGIHLSLRFGWDFLERHGQIDYLANIDSDAVFIKNWLVRLKHCYQQAAAELSPQLVLSGFGCWSRRIKRRHRGFDEVDIVGGGVNFFFARAVYRDAIAPALDNMYWDINTQNLLREKQYVFATINPSVVQHAGMRGEFSSFKRGVDFSVNFYKNPACFLRIYELFIYWFFLIPVIGRAARTRLLHALRSLCKKR